MRFVKEGCAGERQHASFTHLTPLFFEPVVVAREREAWQAQGTAVPLQFCFSALSFPLSSSLVGRISTTPVDSKHRHGR